jgi:hypothetical protein
MARRIVVCKTCGLRNTAAPRRGKVGTCSCGRCGARLIGAEK